MYFAAGSDRDAAHRRAAPALRYARRLGDSAHRKMKGFLWNWRGASVLTLLLLTPRTRGASVHNVTQGVRSDPYSIGAGECGIFRVGVEGGHEKAVQLNIWLESEEEDQSSPLLEYMALSTPAYGSTPAYNAPNEFERCDASYFSKEECWDSIDDIRSSGFLSHSCYGSHYVSEMAVDLTHSEHTDKLAKGRSVRAHFLPSSSSECLVGSGQYYVFVKAKDGATPVVSFELDLLELSHGCSQSFASLAFTLLFSLLVITCGLSCCFVVSRCCARSASVGHQRARGSNRAPNPNRQRSSWFGSRDAAVADAADRRQHGELTRAPSRIVSGWSGIGQREVQIAETSVEPNFGSHQDFIPTTVAVQDSQFSTV